MKCIFQTKLKPPLTVPKNRVNRQVSFTGDEVIDAYYKGQNDERNAFDKAIKILLNGNITLAEKFSVQLLNESEKSKIDLKGIYLKINTIDQFSALFVVDKEALVSDKFLQVYSIAKTLRIESERKDIYMNFSFMPDTGSINGEMLSSDGYYLKYKHSK